MRKRDQNALGLAPDGPDDRIERDLSDESLDRELPDEEDDPGPHEGELPLEPRRAVRDLGRAWLAIPRPARGLAGEALRDRGAVREMVFIDAGAREPSAELRAGASRERQTRRELHRAGRLADDHHAVTRFARNDRERALDEPRIRAPRASANARMKTRERAFIMRCDHVTNVDFTF